MRTAFLVILLVATALAGRHSHHHHHPQRPVQNSNVTEEAILFLEGLAEGIGAEMGNPAQCMVDVEGMVNQFELAFHDLDYGFRHKSIARILDGTNEVADGLKYGADSIQACGFLKVAEDVRNIVVEIQSGKVLEVVVEELIKIFAHGKEVEHLFIGAKDAWKSGDFKTSGNDVGQLVAFLLKPAPKKDINGNVTQEAILFLEGLVEGIGAEMGNPAQCVVDVEGMVNQFEMAFTDLEYGFRHKSIARILDGTNEVADGLKYGVDGFKACGFPKVASEVSAIVVEIQSGHVLEVVVGELIKIFAHGKQVEHLFVGAKDAWKAGDFKTSGNDIGQLIAFLIKPKTDVVAISGNTTQEAILFVEGLTEGLGAITGDPSQCMVNVEGMVNEFEMAFADLDYGFRHKSIAKILDGTNEIADGLKYGANTLEACGFSKVADDVRAIVVEIKSGKVLEVVIKELVKIFAHGKEVEHLFIGAKDAWKAGDFKTSGNDIGQLVAFLLEPSKNDLALKGNVTQEAILFIEGLAEGIGAAMGNPAQCMVDVEGMVNQFELAFADLDYGFRHKSIARILDGTNEVADGLKYGADSIQACGFIKVADDVRKIVVEIQSGKVLEVVVEELIKIFAHGKEVEHLFIGAKDAWKSGDFKTSGNDVGQLVAFLIQPK